jgi:phage antirepressor YoqD-like protein
MNKQELELRQIYNKLDAIITKLDKIYKTKGLIILNNADLLHIFNISPRTLIKWREENLITYSKVGNKIFYRVEHIIEFLDNNKNEMTP